MKKKPFFLLVNNDKLNVINWIHDNCLPCIDQKNTLNEINREIKSDAINITTINFKDFDKKFNKMGNPKVFPIINVFYKGKLIKYKDSNINPDDSKHYLVGKRTKKDMINILEKTIKSIL